ncbi:ESCRT-II complex subunit VPS36 protein [Dioscorea alata]|uniref:ESCRT-II complex subunit VPS36 protein n=2 Tax=Dioscorea alata TaxID=55571 RepID=A0ACB7U103_DIOAL|nr:ESCRT-II complex subunit VPS36 protein [Dioscorea alata]KAH7653987.1 ESCRT-II complex subunit VPS36 protein [Dioscorea alata]
MADDWLPPASLTPSARPVLFPGEIERFLLPSVDLVAEENPGLTPLRSGLLIITSHRLLWIHEPSVSGRSMPLAAVIHVFPMKKSVRSMFASPRVRIQVAVGIDGKVGEKGTRSEVITVVMRGKTDPDVFLGKLWEVLRAKAWEATQKEGSDEMERGESSQMGTRVRMPVVGVSGILRKEQEMWENTDKSLQDAFQDLNALMSKAKEMVMLAEKMRQKLLSGPSSHANSNDEDIGSKQDIQDWLLSVGIVSPVTKESAGALYHQQLSRQLADFVKLPLEKAGGVIALIDVYCLFNRARGTELISPEDLLQACAIWEKFDVPIMLRKFDSGVMVIQNKAHSDEEVLARITALAMKPDALRMGISSTDAALILGIAPAMAKEHLLTAESKGILCRDVSPDGFRFYINLFKEIDPRDIYFAKADGIIPAWVSAALASA